MNPLTRYYSKRYEMLYLQGSTSYSQFYIMDKRPSWTNKISFIITASAFAVGLGNIWRFPYIAGEGGGGAFLIIYLLLVFLFGIPLLVIEMGLGRMSEERPLTGFSKLAGNKLWDFIGWISFVAVVIIMGYYVVIMAWIVLYIWQYITGGLNDLSTSELPAFFNSITYDHSTIIIISALIIIIAALIITRGLKHGIEKFSKGMMVSFVVLLIGMVLWAATLEGASEGYKWYLTPDFSKINLNIILSAIGQLFFSIGVAMAVGWTFGSYTSKENNLVASVSWIVLMDTVIAVIAGFIIFPALFTFNLSPDSGPSLIFITMASAFSITGMGQILGIVFFTLLFLAGFSSILAAFKGMQDSFSDKMKWADSKSLVLLSIVTFMISIPVTYSFSENPVLIFGRDFYTIVDFMTNNIMLPLGGLLLVIFGVYVVGYDKLKKHLLIGYPKKDFPGFTAILVKVFIPVVISIILISKLFSFSL